MIVRVDADNDALPFWLFLFNSKRSRDAEDGQLAFSVVVNAAVRCFPDTEIRFLNIFGSGKPCGPVRNIYGHILADGIGDKSRYKERQERIQTVFIQDFRDQGHQLFIVNPIVIRQWRIDVQAEYFEFRAKQRVIVANGGNGLGDVPSDHHVYTAHDSKARHEGLHFRFTFCGIFLYCHRNTSL